MADLRPIKFFVCLSKGGEDIPRGCDINVEDREPFTEDSKKSTWAISCVGHCLSRSMEWEYEPMPSSRDEQYLKNNRYTFDEALAIAAQLKEKYRTEGA